MRHSRTGPVAAVLLVLGACAETPGPRFHNVTGPDGYYWQAIECASDTACYEGAGQLCPDGYHVLDKSGHVEVEGASYKGTGVVASHYEGTIVVRCKHPRHTTEKADGF
jgi:hypothetical protein